MSIFNKLFGLFSRSKRKRKSTRQKSGAAQFLPTDEAGTAAATVVVANLFGSGGVEAADRVAAVLGAEGRLEVLRRAEALKQPSGANLLERLTGAAEKGRAWLKEENADILIWGEMEDLGTIQRFRFLPSATGGSNQVIGFGLGDVLDLPADSASFYNDLVVAAVYGAVGPVKRGLREPILEGLEARLEKIQGWADKLPEEVPREYSGTVLMTLGNALAAAALIGGGKKLLGRAAVAYQRAGSIIDQNADPLAWAMTQNHLAAVLETQGKKDKAPEPLIQAADRYRGVAEALGRDAHPMDWGMAHVRLGSVLYRLANIDLANITPHLKDAGAAFEEALTVYSKETMPGRWAEVMNQYGVVLMALGDQLAGTATMEQAVTAFKKTLDVRKREHVPLMWAQTANNLGAASFSLAKRDQKRKDELLRDAAGCFEGAAGVYRKTPGYGKRAEVILNNLARVEKLLETKQAS